MYLQGVVRLAFICFLAIELRVVRADEPIALAGDDTDMTFSHADRRRWGIFKKIKKRVKRIVRPVFRWVKRLVTKVDYRKVRRCLWSCRRCRSRKCASRCTKSCYARYTYRIWRRIRIRGQRKLKVCMKKPKSAFLCYSVFLIIPNACNFIFKRKILSL